MDPKNNEIENALDESDFVDISSFGIGSTEMADFEVIIIIKIFNKY